MDQNENNRDGDIKDIFCSKNVEYELLSLYGFSMCTSKMISTGKRPKWRSRGGWESYKGSARSEVT